MICPVCHEQLERINNSYKCKNNHCFDISKEGYVNLLLNSKNSGDNKEMVRSRMTFLNKGYFEPLLKNIIKTIKSLDIKNILDVGCGEGYYDSGIVNATNIPLTGLDISKEACLKASKRNKQSLYVVGSSSHLPFSDNEFDLLLNIFAPHDEEEFTRVCNKYILKVVPNKNHLLELKEILYDDVIIKDEKTLEFSKFKEIKKEDITYKVKVDDLFELFKMTPYFYTTKYDEETFIKNNGMEVTCDFTILLYEKIND